MDFTTVKTYKWLGTIPTYYLFEMTRFLKRTDGDHSIRLANQDGRVVISSTNPVAIEEFINKQYWRTSVRGLTT